MKQSDLLQLLVKFEAAKKELKSLENQVQSELETASTGTFKGFRIFDKPTQGFAWSKYIDFIKPRLTASDLAAKDNYVSNGTKKSFEIL